MGTDEEFLKDNARLRRRQKLYAERWEGLNMGTRVIPSAKQYSRKVKYRPQDIHKWEELED